jgi:hypothetical protein
MGTAALGRMAGDRDEVEVPASAGRWSMAAHLWMEEGAAPIYSRAAREALLALWPVSLPPRGPGRCRNSPAGTAR